MQIMSFKSKKWCILAVLSVNSSDKRTCERGTFFFFYNVVQFLVLDMQMQIPGRGSFFFFFFNGVMSLSSCTELSLILQVITHGAPFLIYNLKPIKLHFHLGKFVVTFYRFRLAAIVKTVGHICAFK